MIRKNIALIARMFGSGGAFNKYSLFGFFITGCIASMCLASCARPGAPTGGPKDTTPPGVDSLKSTPNFQTNFQARSFSLTFDEWVVLKDALSQVVVSPPVEKRPEVKLRGKEVTVTFSEAEVFRSNTTYTVNFGTAVRDLHEDNPAEDLRFVFSTGDVIDSLSVKGLLVDAYEGTPLADVAVVLYDVFEDSVLAKERPYYFARTNKDGQFAIQNVRSDTFKVAAFEDANQNLKWDSRTERVAFLDSLWVVQDSSVGALRLRLFKNQPEPVLLDKQLRDYGQIKLVYNAPPDGIEFIPGEPRPDKLIQWAQNDTLFVWYDQPVDTSWIALAGPDTIELRKISRTKFLEDHTLSWENSATSSSASKKRGRQTNQEPVSGKPNPRVVPRRPGKGLSLDFNFPITQVDSSRFYVQLDSARVYGFNPVVDSLVPFRVNIQEEMSQGKSYELMVLPGAVTDLYGTANVDTLTYIINIPTEKQLSILNLTISGLQDSMAYLLEIHTNNKVEETRTFVASGEQQRLTFPSMNTLVYELRLVEDRNANGRWDSGDYYKHLQPERIFSHKLEALKANWEVEAEMDIRGKKKIF